MCRPFAATFRNHTKYNGLNVGLFGMDFTEGDNFRPECHCREDGTCPPKGTFDMFRCSGVPMYGSSPHFYQSEELLKGIESGLNPNHKDHGVDIYLDFVSDFDPFSLCFTEIGFH